MKEYKIGQIVPYIPPRGIAGKPLPSAVWHALTVPGGREAAARDMLGCLGVHAEFPVRERKYQQRGKSIVRKLPIITRVIYAQFKAEPQWDILKQRKLITGVYGIGERPLVIPYNVVRSVMGLPTVEEELEQARRELLMAREGEQATILDGPLSGFVVDVEKVAGGMAWFSTLAGIKGSAAITSLERKA